MSKREELRGEIDALRSRIEALVLESSREGQTRARILEIAHEVDGLEERLETAQEHLTRIYVVGSREIDEFEGGVTVELQSKHPHRTWWLVVEGPKGRPPQELFDALRAAGFEQPQQPPVPDVGGRQEWVFGRRGTGLFAGWTPDEEQRYVALYREVLGRFGFADVPQRRMTMADLL